MSTAAGLDEARRPLAADDLAALARAVASAAGRRSLAEALPGLAEAARFLAGADAVLVRVLDGTGERLEAVAVAGPAALRAELEASHLPADELPDETLDSLDAAPAAVRRAAERAAAHALLLVPVRVDGRAASLELLRSGSPFSAAERAGAELAAAQVCLLLRAFAEPLPGAAPAVVRSALELAGEALAAALDEANAAAEIVRLATEAAGARVGLLWEQAGEGTLALSRSHGLADGADLESARALAAEALVAPGPLRTLPGERLPDGCGLSTALPLGRPATAVLQLLHPPAAGPGRDELAALATFGVRVAQALRAGERAHSLALELERTRALLAVIAQATAELSVAHTLETAVDRVADLLAVERVAVYLRAADGGLETAAARGLAGPHVRLAERLLELALGAARGRAVVEVDDAAGDRRTRAGAAAREAGIRGALAVPLRVGDDVTGLLAVYPPDPRRPSEHETALLAALAGQLAVAVQNAQLHEQATRLGEEREAALDAERAASRRLRAAYEVSRAFAQSLSLERTLGSLARTAAELLDVDAALIRMPDARREQLVPQALHVRDPQLEESVRALVFRAQPFGNRTVQRLFRDARTFRIGPGDHPSLSPLLEKGWTAAVVPVALPGEVLAALTILSLRPGSPISDETIEAATVIAGQAALAIDNARLYRQQKQFADTMQRSLLPRSRPRVPGLEVGEVYESSARVDVGGDVYDFLPLDDGRLAVVLGDVTGHGVDATADMAMAKFVFRSLAREHPEPSAFLAAANDVVVDEIAAGKFISMTYVAVDGGRGRVACASAGHPAPRLVLPDGTVGELAAKGLVLGIDSGQEYVEARAELPPGSSLVLYTDGVVEARRNHELYGVERLDQLLAERCGLPALELAHAVAEDARGFAGGELADDLAVVVIRRT